MPLRKRGPQLRKRTPSRSGRGGRGPGAAGERALRPNVVASPTGPRSSTQSPHHAKNRQNRTDRASTDARPRLQPPVPTSDSSPTLPRPPSASPRWSTHRSHSTYQSTHHTRPCPVAAAPPPAQQHPPGQTRPIPGTSRKGGQRNALAPLSRKPRREAKEAPGGGAAARSRLRRTPRNEHQETNTKRRTGRGDRAIEITRKEKPERFRDGVNRSAALMGEEHSARMSAVRLALVPSNRLVSMDLVPACPLDW
jgi:hypothetical protein